MYMFLKINKKKKRIYNMKKEREKREKRVKENKGKNKNGKKWKEKKRQRLRICPIFLFHIVFNRYLVYCVDVIYFRYACLMVPPPPWLMTEADKVMRWQLNHEESPDGSWRNEISDESWRISWWILTKWDIWWVMKNLLMDLDEMRFLMNHEESPDGSWRNETAAASWRIPWWTLDGCGSPSVAMPTLAKTMCTKEA